MYARLTEGQLRNRLHEEEGVFICESEKVIRVALERGVEPVSFLCEEKFVGRVESLFPQEGVSRYSELPVYVGSREVLKGLTGYELSRGMLCCMKRANVGNVECGMWNEECGMRSDECGVMSDEELGIRNCECRNCAATLKSEIRNQKSLKMRVGVLDGVVNSENTGAIFRAAAALGIDALLLTRTCCDPLNRRACRVSMGTVFQVPWGWIDNVECGDQCSVFSVQCLVHDSNTKHLTLNTKHLKNTKHLTLNTKHLKSYPEVLREMGFKTVALALTDRSVSIDDPVLKGEERLAIVLGTEGDGLSESVLRECDYVARIPMQRGVDSLNVAAAASVAFWELRIGRIGF